MGKIWGKLNYFGEKLDGTFPSFCGPVPLSQGIIGKGIDLLCTPLDQEQIAMMKMLPELSTSLMGSCIPTHFVSLGLESHNVLPGANGLSKYTV